MTERGAFDLLITGWFIIAGIIFVSLFFVTAPYGRHARRGWGPRLNSRLGWIIMETPSPIAFAICFAIGEFRTSTTALVFLAMWEAHYVHRAFVYPSDLRSEDRRMPLTVVAMGALFNLVNACLNGR